MVDESNNINSLRILSAIGIIVGTWSLLFEIYFFKGFDIDIYFARVIFTIVTLFIFYMSYRNNSRRTTDLLIHIFLIALIGSFAFTIYKIPQSVYINSQILSLLIFTTAIIFSWEINNQIIVGIYYNLLFAGSILLDGYKFYFLPNIFSVVIFVSLISALSVAASFVNYNLRKKLLIRSKEREEAQNMLLNVTREKQKNAQKALIEKQQKLELLAKVNHEVRTPLNSILTYIDMINHGYIETMDDVKQYSSAVKVSSQGLLNTINNFVEYAKVESGSLKVEKQYFNLKELHEQVTSLLDPLAKGNGNTLVLIDRCEHEMIYTDPAKYRQILTNLIANAIKFTTNGVITVCADTYQVTENEYELVTSVEDTGPGIPKAQLESIFDPFITMKNSGALTYSSGLGLTICREFITSLEGRITVESEVGKGTKFSIRLPFDVQRSTLVPNGTTLL